MQGFRLPKQAGAFSGGAEKVFCDRCENIVVEGAEPPEGGTKPLLLLA
jgi:hypothetical protein